MTRSLVALVAFFIALLLAIPAGTLGDSTTLPPKVIEIHREYVLPGELPAYEGAAAAAAQTCARLNCPSSYLGLKSITGPSQVWYLSWFDNYASIEQSRTQAQQNAALQDALDSSAARKPSFIKWSDVLFAEYRPELSYGSNTSLPAARYFWIQIVTILPGHSTEFETFRRSERAADGRARAGATVYVYRVTSGARGNVYLIITLGRTLEEADNLAQLRREERYEPGREQSSRLAASSIAATENDLFAPQPALSYLPKSWTDSDAAFWAPAAGKQ